MTAFPSHRPPPARREALLSRLSAATDMTRALDAQLASHPDADPAGLLVPAARALLGVLQRCGGGELVVSLGSDERWAVRVRHGASGPSADLVPVTRPPGAPAAGRPAPHPGDAAPVPDSTVAARLAEVLRAGGVR